MFGALAKLYDQHTYAGLESLRRKLSGESNIPCSSLLVCWKVGFWAKEMSLNHKDDWQSGLSTLESSKPPARLP